MDGCKDAGTCKCKCKSISGLSGCKVGVHCGFHRMKCHMDCTK